MNYGFQNETLTADQLNALEEARRRTAADVVRLTSLAGCGHPGGSLSTLDALLTIYACGTFDPKSPHAADRDRVVVSHGHITPGVYATLGHFGFFDMNEAYAGFRKAGSVFGGHVETVVPGVEWNTGNLGQGFSAACGFATAARVHDADWHTWVLMGDGEQQKGQVAEARRYARKFKLANMTALVDVNGLQIGGETADIMDVDLEAEWRAAGWNVLIVDGHDFKALYAALRSARMGTTDDPGRPTVLLLRTVMGKGISAIEGLAKYHGQALTDEMAAAAFDELGQPNDLEKLRALRAERTSTLPHHIEIDREIKLNTGTPRTYEAGTVTDCRSGYGSALADLAEANIDSPQSWPIIGLSCDLEGSVKMNAFHKAQPERFFEAGIQEHTTAVVAGAASKERVIPFFSTFGMFGVVEAYNQQRLNDQNEAAPKTVVTHCGLDVGEDGPTHQCIDYVSLAHNLFGMELYVPADANETDRIIRTVAGRYAPTIVAMGRSKLPTIGTPDGEPALGGDYTFEPGRWTTLREGDDAVVFAFGPMVYRAVEASDRLREEGLSLRVVNASSLKPYDRDCIIEAATRVGRLLTYEDHNVNSGLGSIVAGVLGDEGIAARLRRMGVTRYGTSGKPDDLFAEQGLAPEDLMAKARELAKS